MKDATYARRTPIPAPRPVVVKIKYALEEFVKHRTKRHGRSPRNLPPGGRLGQRVAPADPRLGGLYPRSR